MARHLLSRPASSGPALHWSAAYVGLTLRGPRGCWELVRRVYEAERGVALPPFSAGDWREIAQAEARDFDLLLFAAGGLAEHVGLVAGDGLMLHAPSGQASVVEPWHDGRFLPSLKGLYRHEAGCFEAPHAGQPSQVGHVNVVGLPFINPAEDRIEVLAPAGSSVAAMMRLAFPAASEDQLDRMHVWIGRPGNVIAPELRHRVFPHPGTVLVIQPLPGALFGRILAFAAAIAAMAAGQFYLGPMAATALGFAKGTAAYAATTAVVTAASVTAVSVATGFLTGARGGGESGRPSFVATGWQNEAHPYGVVPAPAGRHRMAPPFGATSFLRVLGDDDIRLVALFVEGIGPLAKSEMRIGDTPIEEFDGGKDESGLPIPISIESNQGLPDDEPHTLYDHQVVGSEGMGVTLPPPAEDNWVTRVSPRDVQDLEIIVGHPYGLFDYDDDTGEIESTANVYELRYREVGAVDWIAVPEFSEVSRARDKPFFVSHKWTPAARGTFEVGLRLADILEGGDNGKNDAQWVELYGHRPEYPLNFPVPVASTAIEIRGSEQLQGQLDQFNLVVSRIAPDYDFATGTWIERETANPASYARWALQGPANAKPKTDAKVNLPELVALHDFCRTKGLSYHSLIDAAAPLPEALAAASSAGRALPRHDGRKWGFVIDRPRTVVSGHITPRNGWEVAVSRPRVDLDDGFVVSFRDETSNWEVKQRRIPFPEVVDPQVFRTLDLPGKTHPDEIYREAMRRHFEETYRRKIYAAAQGWDAMTLAQGVLAMFDDGLDRGTVSAHCRSAAGNMVELDEFVTMVADGDYELRFRHLPAEGSEAADAPPAESVVRAVSTIAGRSKVVVLAGSGTLPEPGDLCMFGPVTQAAWSVVVQRIEAGSNLTARLTCLDAAPIIDELTDALVIPPWDGRVGDIINVDAEPPENIAVATMFNLSATGDLSAFGHVTWDADPDHAYQVRWRKIGSATAGTVSAAKGVGEAATGLLIAADDYEIGVRVRNGVWSDWVAVPDETLLLADDDTIELADDGTMAVAD